MLIAPLDHKLSLVRAVVVSRRLYWRCYLTRFHNYRHLILSAPHSTNIASSSLLLSSFLSGVTSLVTKNKLPYTIDIRHTWWFLSSWMSLCVVCRYRISFPMVVMWTTASVLRKHLFCPQSVLQRFVKFQISVIIFLGRINRLVLK